MKILIICPESDPAGVAWNLCKALDQYTEHKVRYICGFKTYAKENGEFFLKGLEDNTDIVVTEKKHALEYIEELIRNADVLHFNKYDWKFKEYFDFGRYIKNQRIVFHGHGGSWLLDPQSQIERCKEKKAAMVTCSPIDEVVVPGIKWLPNILFFNKDCYSPDWGKDFEGKLEIGLSNNCPVYKGGEIVRYVVDYLKKFGYNLNLEVLQNTPLKDCLEKRKKHHFTIDNWTQGFFGMAGLEGLALGHVMIARLDPLAKKKWKSLFDIPVEDVHGMDECAKVIREYYSDRSFLKEKCQYNRKWMEENYRPDQVVKLWGGFYESL